MKWCVISLNLFLFFGWGWFKYRYREHDKPNFQAVKDAAVKYLNACPLDVLRRFINRSLLLMDAYRAGLTGQAAEWAVRKQKQHRGVSPTAAAALDRAAGRSRQEVLDELQRRLKNDDAAEAAEAKEQLRQIAALRLGSLFGDGAA